MAVEHDILLSPYTSWCVGGVADRLYRVADLDALSQFLSTVAPEEPLLWIGKGSNLLVRDGGFRGTVILLSEGADTLKWLPDQALYAEAGVALSRLSRFAHTEDQHQLDFLAGIPGSVGGALAMNAGAFGGEIWQQVASVEVMNRQGQRRSVGPEAYKIGYRSVEAVEQQEPHWFVAARFKLGEKRVEESAVLKQQLKQRNQSQPMAQYSCGSVFRNPQGDHAGRLIEAAGLKGECIGAACVSEQHANFIVHSGGASAGEIEALILHVQHQVEAQSGVRLQTEVKIVGEA